MALKGLIKKQTIIIDDHKRGNQEIKNWDSNNSDVHIDKKTNYPIEGKRQNIRIRIPINSQRPIKIEYGHKMKLKDIPSKLSREIQNAFEDKEQRDRFIRDIVEYIKNFDTLLKNEDRVKNVLSNISMHFDLKWTKDKIAIYTKDALSFYTQSYTDDSGKKYFISVDKDKITVGEKSGFAKNEYEKEIKGK